MNLKNKNSSKQNSIPNTNSNLTDSTFKCSDSYKVTGETINETITSTSDICKSTCTSDSNCVGFNYDKKNNICKTFSDVTNFEKAKKNNSLCIKKLTGSKCLIPNASIPMPGMTEETGEYTPNIVTPMISKISNHNNVNKNNSCAFQKLDIIFDYINNPDNFINSDNEVDIDENDDIEFETQTPTQISTPTPTPTPTNTNNIQSKEEINSIPHPKIYIDVNCYSNQIEKLKSDSNTFMIDLDVLNTNIKSCAYTPKNNQEPIKPYEPEFNKTETESEFGSEFKAGTIINKVISKIEVPNPSTVDIDRQGQILKENFASSSRSDKFDWISTDLIILIVITFILYFFIFSKCDKNSNK